MPFRWAPSDRLQDLWSQDLGLNRSAARPMSAAELVSFSGGTSPLALACFRPGAPEPKGEATTPAHRLFELAEIFRLVVGAQRLSAPRAWLPHFGILLRGKTQLDYTECRGNLESFQRELNGILQCPGMSGLSTMKPLIRYTKMAVEFARTRSADLVVAQYSHLVRGILDHAREAVTALNGDGLCKVPPSRSKLHAWRDSFLAVRGELEESWRSAIADRTDPSGRQFFEARARIIQEGPKQTLPSADFNASALSGRLSRLFTARHAALVSVVAADVEKFCAAPSEPALESLLASIRALKPRESQQSDLARGLFVTSHHELNEFLEDLELYLNSAIVRENCSRTVVSRWLRAVVRGMQLDQEVQEWTTPDTCWHGNGALTQFLEDGSGLWNRLKRWYARAYLIVCGPLFAIRGNETSPGGDGWYSFRRSERKGDTRAHSLELLEKLTSLAEESIKKLEWAKTNFLPREEPIRMQFFEPDRGTPAPDSLLQRVVELEKENLLAPDGAERLGFRTIFPLEDLRARVHTHGASVVSISSGNELLMAFVLSDKQDSMPPSARRIQELIESAQQARWRPEVPRVFCELAVEKPEARWLHRELGTTPNVMAQQLVRGLIQAKYMFEPWVKLFAYCRADNPAIVSHRRTGLRVVPGVTYADEAGENLLLEGDICPSAGVFSEPTPEPTGESA